MLLQIREFISREQVVSTQQLTREFHIDEQALQPILDIWVKRGVICVVEGKTSCKTKCFRCDSKQPVFYQMATN